MKKILLLALVAFGMNAKAQITLEHTYDSAAIYNICQNKFSQLMIINFEVSGYRYVKINRCGHRISIYDMHHTLLKNISLTGLPVSVTPPYGEFLYISQNLFNLDSLIEFMYVYDTGTWYITRIYNEDATLIFADTSAPFVHPNYEMQQYPIYNTSQGTKMILSCQNGDARVFHLPGTLSTFVEEGNAQLEKSQGGKLGNLYPNPSSSTVTLQYELPEGVREGTIVLYNMEGKEIKRYRVDNTFHDLQLDNTQLPAGTYFYQLQTTSGMIGSKKMIKMK